MTRSVVQTSLGASFLFSHLPLPSGCPSLPPPPMGHRVLMLFLPAFLIDCSAGTLKNRCSMFPSLPPSPTVRTGHLYTLCPSLFISFFSIISISLISRSLRLHLCLLCASDFFVPLTLFQPLKSKPTTISNSSSFFSSLSFLRLQDWFGSFRRDSKIG